MKNQEWKVEREEQTGYWEIAEKTTHCLPLYCYPGSVWKSTKPEIFVEVDKEWATTGQIRVTLNYLGDKHICFLDMLRFDNKLTDCWLEPYIEEWRNRKKGENLFFVLTEENKMTWHFFHYIVDRSHGINQYKVYDEIPFERIK